nr:glycosyltransferase family 4 protein [uncultured Devosia sp.]
MTSRLRVLLIAEACNPEWVSVPLVGWSMASALREVADIHLVTQVRNREALLRAGLTEGVDFTAIDSEAVAKPLWRLGSVLRMGEGKGWTTVQAIETISYRYFEHLVWRRFKKQLRDGAFDIVHRLTPLSPAISSSLAGKCRTAGIPFVLGPLNGGVPWPKQFDAARRQEREWLSHVRGAYKLLPSRQSTMKADAIIAGSRHTQSEIPSHAQARTIYMPENGIDPRRFSTIAQHKPGKLRACFVGRMVPVKGTDMALEASLPLLKAGLMTLDFVGDGQMVEALKADVRQHGVEEAVTFHGWVDHGAVQQILSESTLFLFPSVKDFGGGAALEAMALGVPPLVLDYAGPGELVDDSTGFKIPMGTRDEIVVAMQALLSSLAGRPDLLKAAGMRARQRVESLFVWHKKAGQMLEIYRFALGQTGKPQPIP